MTKGNSNSGWGLVCGETQEDFLQERQLWGQSKKGKEKRYWGTPGGLWINSVLEEAVVLPVGGKERCQPQLEAWPPSAELEMRVSLTKGKALKVAPEADLEGRWEKKGGLSRRQTLQ